MNELKSNAETIEDDNWYSEVEYRDALTRLGDGITSLQRSMLVAHAEAPDRVLSVFQLANAAGYDHPNVTYLHYGNLGHLIANKLGVQEKPGNWTNFIGCHFRTKTRVLMWEMHPELAAALMMLGWASGAGAKSSLDFIAQADEVNALPDMDTEREAVIQERIGQASFRDALLRSWGKCAVTGVAERAVLRASHIKPWRIASNKERLNPDNGLLLAAHIDALFDAGLITFEVDGQIRLSPLLAEEDQRQLGITGTMRLRHTTAEHEVYMQHHRKFVFRAGDGDGA